MQTIQQRIDALWNRPSMAKLNWLELEQLLGDILRASKHRTDLGDHSTDHSADYYLRAIDEALGAFTHRGQVYPTHSQGVDAPLFAVYYRDDETQVKDGNVIKVYAADEDDAKAWARTLVKGIDIDRVEPTG